MRINDRNTLGPAASEAGRTAETQKIDWGDSSRQAKVNSGGDRVELSSTLGRLSQAISSADSQRASRVQSLAADYQAGKYRPNAAATSRGMISEALSTGRS